MPAAMLPWLEQVVMLFPSLSVNISAGILRLDEFSLFVVCFDFISKERKEEKNLLPFFVCLILFPSFCLRSRARADSISLP